ncbi:hypothetical protein LUZ61_006207 [Rhynchospora tenuis]|uniref:Uncharacterized protein n=1 Tax=Rhynchospora tenuis TaxID=198213 RepID=A0AAD5ZR76_9POAL|nr:hypothetical protein LUZ61_006207 [Rhynchospora tenuis]
MLKRCNQNVVSKLIDDEAALLQKALAVSIDAAKSMSDISTTDPDLALERACKKETRMSGSTYRLSQSRSIVDIAMVNLDWFYNLHVSKCQLKGKVALITGGASGIGKETAKLFAQQGARVVIADIQEEYGQVLANEPDGSSICSYIHCDVTNEPDVKNAVDTTIDRYGKLDIMFNNAGILGAPDRQIAKSDKSNFEKVLSVNLMGNYLGLKHAAWVMIPAGQGSIISTVSITSSNLKGATFTYECSKHAVVALMKSTAIELGKHGIRVNCVSPAIVATPMATEVFEMDEEGAEEVNASCAAFNKRVKLKANDVPQTVMYLASNESKYVNGLNLVVDGAFTALPY